MSLLITYKILLHEKLDAKNKLEAQERKGEVSVTDGEDEGGNKQC